jgi:L-ascorbate metabolism protein UlaG (beta-lactamase superfamily)
LITWVGHATALIEIDGVRIITDPVLRNRVGFLIRHGPQVRSEWSRNIDAVLLSHLHHDHLDLPSLKRLTGDTKVIAPRGSFEFLRKAGIDNIEELDVGATVSIKDIKISATFAEHDGFRVPFGPSSPAVGYIIEGSKRIYFAGDTELFSDMDGLGSPLDIALVPVGGWGLTLRYGHLNPWTATEALGLLRPRVAVPIHWGTLWIAGLGKVFHTRFRRPGPEFARLASLHAPQTTVCLTSPGQPVVLPEDF